MESRGGRACAEKAVLSPQDLADFCDETAELLLRALSNANHPLAVGLKELKDLKALTTLTLYRPVSSLDALKDLKSLTTLTLSLWNSPASSFSVASLRAGIQPPCAALSRNLSMTS